MFRGLIALLVACVLAITSLTAPAYADSNQVGGLSVGAKQISDSHDIIIVSPLPEPPSPDFWKSFVDGVVNGALETAGAAIGGAAICFIADGVATTVFPPAGVLLPYCSGLGATVGTRNAVENGFDAVAKAM